MSKYLEVFKITWQEGFTYRLNFALWRLRTVLQLLLVYFTWWTVFQSRTNLFGYTRSEILTYILVSSFIKAIVVSSKSTEVSNQINEGSVVNFLVKPLGFIKYYFSRDLADKLLNISFSVCEVTLLIILLNPHFLFQKNIGTILMFLFAALLGVTLNFCMQFIISLTAFWVESSWGPMFLFSIFLETLGGGLFPIDILPKPAFNFLMSTPFPYLVYFPARVYLGTLSLNDLSHGFIMSAFWVIALFGLTIFTLRAGLRHYTAGGN